MSAGTDIKSLCCLIFFFFMEIKREAGWVKGVVEPYSLLVKRQMITSASKPKVQNIFHWTILAQMVKNLPSVQKTQVPRPRWVWKIPWRREWQPTLVFLPGEFHGERNVAGYHPWDRKESDMTEWLIHTHTHTQPIQSVPEKTDTMS